MLDAAARNLNDECRGDRTLPQLRADVFGDIMTMLATYGRVDIRCSAGVRHADEHPDPDAGPTGDLSGMADHRADIPAPAWVPLGSSVAVTVAASTLAGLDNDPALLAGHGCITADLARNLAVSARRAAIIVERSTAAPTSTSPPGPMSPPEPVTSKPFSSQEGPRTTSPGDHAAWCSPELDFGREIYRPPAALRELVFQRDRTCRFPGCAQPSRRCDLDHRIPFRRNASDATVGGAVATDDTDGGAEDAEGGTTCPCNLDLLCRFHHRVKTFTGWSAVRLPGNTLAWTSPLGFRHVDQVDTLPVDRWTSEHDDPAPF